MGAPNTTRDTDFAKLWAAASTSLLGDGIRTAALPLLAAALSPTAAAVSIVTFAGTVPILLFTLLGGALADRHDRRNLMWRIDLVRGLLVAAFAVWVLTTAPPLWGLIVMTFLLGSAGAVFDTISGPFIADLVDPDDLAKANGRLQAAQLISFQFLGPPLGAALFALSAGAPLLVDAVTFVAAAGLVFAIRARHAPARAEVNTTIRADIAEGVRWLWRHKGLRLLALELGVANLAVQMALTMLVLLIVNTLHAPAAVYGLVLAIGAVGGMLGGLAGGWVRRHLRLGPGLGLAIGMMAVGLLVAGVAWSIPVVAVGYTVGCFGILLWNVQAVVVRQRLTPRELMGRVTSAYRLVGWGAGPVGAALSGVLGTVLDVRAPIIIGGVVLALSLLLVPRLGALEQA
ncbi:MFS transporter [Kutzneria sp. 744]|uniref:MFS transporter n=1 Tax=Kutzneria sp. (strain 744) TaxID=345341 RepID=UPI0003EED30D|nr:MFS transporter [Kutzneria sp. 744]EWM11524.1 major facilitator superfamily transporter [Kutzneria sp. 744]